MCVREEIHSQGRSSRCWEKYTHWVLLNAKKQSFFLLFIFMINNSAVLSAFLISEKMNSK